MFYLLRDINSVFFSRIKSHKEAGLVTGQWMDGRTDADWGFKPFVAWRPPPPLSQISRCTHTQTLNLSLMWHVGQRMCLSLLMKSKQKKNPTPTLSPWTSDHVPPYQHAVHRLSGLIWVTKCSSEVGQDTWGRAWGENKKTALLHPVWLLPGQRQKQERPGHLPHSVKIEVLWGTDLPKVSSSVSNKCLQQPSPVGHHDLCGGSVNGKKIVAAFQGHMQMKSQTGNTYKTIDAVCDISLQCILIFGDLCRAEKLQLLVRAEQSKGREVPDEHIQSCRVIELYSYTDFNWFSNGSWIPNSSRFYLSADCLVAHFSTLECLQSLPTLARVRIDFSFGRFSFSSSFLPQISVKRKMSGTEGLIRS